MEYQEPTYYGKKATLDLLKTALTIEQIGDILIGISFNEPDLEFALSIIIPFCYDKNPEIQGLAILCLAHLAKFHDDMPVERIVTIFDDVINGDSKNELIVQSRMSDALNDFYTFCPAVFYAVKAKHKQYLETIDLGIDL